jgi:2-iminobutanoate/2-iminopropanoate deaminase
MSKEVIHTEKAPKPGPYSQAIKYGTLIFVSGQTSEDPITNQVVHDLVAAQTRRILQNIQNILVAAGQA